MNLGISRKPVDKTIMARDLQGLGTVLKQAHYLCLTQPLQLGSSVSFSQTLVVITSPVSLSQCIATLGLPPPTLGKMTSCYFSSAKLPTVPPLVMKITLQNIHLPPQTTLYLHFPAEVFGSGK